MNRSRRQYLFGLIFLAFAVYQSVIRDYLECLLYGVAGLAFIFNAATFEPRFLPYKKFLVITTWILIISTGIIFLYLLQFKYL